MRGLHGKAANSETTPLLTAKKTSYFTKLKSLFPYLFPDTLKLKFLTVLCMLLLLAQRVVNLLVPLYFKLIIDSLAPTPEFAWPVILIYILFRLLQGSGGLLANLQSFLWIRVSQFTSRKISVEMLRHLHNLSLEFHLKRKTGEVLRVMDRGTSSVGSLLSMLLFNIVPIFIDIAVAIVSFVVLFDWTFGLIVFIAILIYIILTIVITEWRTRFRREMIDLDNAFSARAVDSLLNFESVKYFNAESWEVDQYDNAIKKYQDADWKSQSSLNVLNVSQNLVITAGLLAGCLLCAYRVAVLKNSTVGDFVLFMTYLTQLYAPLNWFGTMFIHLI